MKEAHVLAALERRLRALGPECVFVKVHGSPFQTAALDVVGAYRGQAFSVETKAPGGRLTPRQGALVERWRAAGAVVWMVDSTERADAFVVALQASHAN